MKGSYSIAAVLLLHLLVMQAGARSLGNYATSTTTTSSSSNSNDGTKVYVHKLAAVSDVTLSHNHNLHDETHLAVGRMPSSNNARALLKFQPIPESCKYVAKAELFAYYKEAYIMWIYNSRYNFDPLTIQVRQVLTEWKEKEATWLNRVNGQPWRKGGMELNDTDAAKEPEETSQTIEKHTNTGYMKFDVTSLAQRWTAGDQDYGLVLTLSDEEKKGREIRLYSSEAEDVDGMDVKPYLKVTCWSDFCAPLAQRRGGQEELLRLQQQQQQQQQQEAATSETTTPEPAQQDNRQSKTIGGSNVPANSLHGK